MLTAFQCDRVAYLRDGDIICRSCVVDEYEDRRQARAEENDLGELTWAEDDAAIEELLGYAPLIRYTVDEEWPGGLDCGSCGEAIVEPDPDYCSAHDGWKDGVADGTPYCDQVDGPGSCTYDPEEE